MVGVGEKCPEIDGLEFLKGDKVQVPVPGRVTIIELWASWCGPCRQMFPHLTDLQRKNKSLHIVGISTEQASPALTKFVESQGYAMDYTVACDEDQEVQNKLMGPAGVRGIPHAFVVDHVGMIQYSGHPGDPNFDSTVTSCLDSARPPKVPLPLIASTREELAAMPVKALKQILQERSIKILDLNEKSEFVDRVIELCATTTYYGEAPASYTPSTASASANPAHSPSSQPKPAETAQLTEIPEDLCTASVKLLRTLMKERGISSEGCLEKSELLARLRENL
ncbi:hypothetical protein CYMTET_50910 [Cymbomonas tetramitiformis]|uniref:glutaredoxin-dependent peroxiredoxin n=1 Tax=Cymbomonas tetramitiformis TaxID=36881 RepID=A0AAE0BM61_9CHLO|nr:hypothetical protein CYMTET_50910 [Cymbomonas tetramitiformis]